MIRFRNIVFILVLVFIFIEVLIIFPKKIEHQRNVDSEKRAVNEDSSAEQKMEGVHLVETKNGVRDWELFSKVAEGYEGKGAWELKQVKVQYFNNEKLEFTVTGDKGNIDTKSKDMTIQGNVQIISANSYAFKAKEVFYKSQLRQIQSLQPIHMRGPKDEQGEGLDLSGDQMTVFIDQSKMLIRGNIQAQKEVKLDKKFFLSSEEAEFSAKSKEAIFREQVIMNYNKMKIEGPKASFYYSSGKDILSSVQLAGGVRVSDEDKYATSENVNLDLLTNKFTFTGQPRVYQNDDELTGEQIVFIEGGKKVKVEKIRAKVKKVD